MSNQVTYFNYLPADIAVGMFEYQNTAGHTWAISTGIITLASPNYYVLGFKTPKTGFNVLAKYEVEKTGDELLLQLSGTVTSFTGASPITNVFNLNRAMGSDVSPFTITGGSSPTVALTTTNLAGDTLIPGVSQGNVFSTSVQTSGQIIILKNDNQYVLKISALGGSTKFTFRLFLTGVPDTSKEAGYV